MDANAWFLGYRVHNLGPARRLCGLPLFKGLMNLQLFAVIIFGKSVRLSVIIFLEID